MRRVSLELSNVFSFLSLYLVLGQYLRARGGSETDSETEGEGECRIVYPYIDDATHINSIL